jgi:hypothetical protein
MAKQKRVWFKPIVIIYECPNYDDMIDILWWNYEDKQNATKSSIDEINNLMTIHPKMKLQDAIKLLYQPNNISYNPNNFDTTY